MTMLLPAGSFVLGLGLAALLFRKQESPALRVSGEALPPAPSFIPTSHFRGEMHRGQTYRFSMRVDPRMQDLMGRSPRQATMTKEAFLSEAMKPIVMCLGFTEPVLVIHDPTDREVWTVLARWDSLADHVLSARYVTPLRTEPVADPPAFFKAKVFRKDEATPVLDEGLNDDEVWAVTFALAKDGDTRHLGGFASTFEPDFPVTAGLLRIKSMLAAVRSYRSRPGKTDAPKTTSSLVRTLKKASEGLGEEVDKTWDLYDGLPLSSKDMDTISRAVKELGEAHVARLKGKGPVPDKLTPAALQLALSTRRPQLSMVSNPDGILNKLREIRFSADAGDPKATEAQRKLEAATRFMERRKWVDWYKRTSALEDEEGPAPGSLTGVLTQNVRRQHGVKAEDEVVLPSKGRT